MKASRSTRLRIADCGLRYSTRANPKSAYQTLNKILVFTGQGLVPTVIQDEKSKQVLTLCYLNREALKKSLETGIVYLFRRSHNRLMRKGETSGHVQLIRRVFVDCEGKSLLFLVKQRVGACHAGYFSCYFRRLSSAGALEIASRKVFEPRRVYRQRANAQSRQPTK